MLTKPGLSSIVSAIIGARKIFQRMTTFTKYTVATTFRICFTFGLLTVIYNWYGLARRIRLKVQGSQLVRPATRPGAMLAVPSAVWVGVCCLVWRQAAGTVPSDITLLHPARPWGCCQSVAQHLDWACSPSIALTR